MNTDFSPIEKWVLRVLVLLVLLALFLNSGIFPLYLEEPRRALIAMEMLINDNWWVPTEYGEFYYRKPPIWNWLIMVAFKLFGEYSETAVRFFGMLSYLAIGWLIYWSGRKHVGERFGAYAALFFLTFSDGLFYLSVVAGEIDLFYSAVTFAQFVLIYHFLQKEKYYWLFLSCYFLTGIGLLTKGMPSLAFTALTLLAVFVDRRQFFKLFHPAHFAGIGLLALMVGGYLYQYQQYHSVQQLLFSEGDSILAQSEGKSFVGKSWGVLISHALVFPFEQVLLKLLPVPLLFVFIWKKKAVSAWLQQPFLRFWIVVFLANIWIYWFSPEARSRYLYMLYPAPIMLAVFGYLQYRAEQVKINRAWERFSMGIVVILAVATFALPFLPIPAFGPLQALWIPSLLVGALFLATLWLLFKYPALRGIGLVIGFVLARIMFDCVVLPLRAEGDRKRKKEEGIAIGKILIDKPVFYYKDTTPYKEKAFYTERETMQLVGIKQQADTVNYFLADAQYVDLAKDSIFYQYTENEIVTYLVKFANVP